jgi:hypothetical protein
LLHLFVLSHSLWFDTLMNVSDPLLIIHVLCTHLSSTTTHSKSSILTFLQFITKVFFNKKIMGMEKLSNEKRKVKCYSFHKQEKKASISYEFWVFAVENHAISRFN